jgi:hypothetical protein
MLSFDDLELQLAGWSKADPSSDPRRWTNSAGDQLLLEFFPVPPDLPAPLDDLTPLRGLYREMLGGEGGIVEVESFTLAGTRAVRAIFKIPQNPAGMTYAGVVTIPFRDCSFVLKWDCPEYGPTGIRDSAVFASFDLPFDEATGHPTGWAEDPYEPSHQAVGLRNRSDDEEWDSTFPSHPLSRLRSYISALGQIRFSGRVAREPPFVFRGPR